MKSLPKRTRQLLILGALIVFVLFAGLSLPKQVGALQSTPDPTPAITSTAIYGEIPLELGETQGLMLGAGIILFIILSGGFIQRIIQKFTLKSPEK